MRMRRSRFQRLKIHSMPTKIICLSQANGYMPYNQPYKRQNNIARATQTFSGPVGSQSMYQIQLGSEVTFARSVEN